MHHRATSQSSIPDNRSMYRLMAQEAIETGLYTPEGLPLGVTSSYAQLLNDLNEIECFVLDALEGDLPAFQVQERSLSQDQQCTVPILKKRTPAEYLHRVIDLFSVCDPQWRYSPHVELFFDCCFQLELQNESFRSPREWTSRPGKQAFELFNDLIEAIRIGARSPVFRNKLSRKDELFRDNMKSSEEYIDCMFSKSARLLVIREDFSYSREFASDITFDEARRDFMRFLKSYRRHKRLSKYRVGDIWAMEYAPDKKYHFHCFFIYNEKKRQDDTYWGKQIGEHWLSLTRKGHYWNCNTAEYKHKYDRFGKLGIGKIHRDDRQKRANLSYILAYILKTRQHLLIKELDGAHIRLFGKGECTSKSGIRTAHRMNLRASRVRPERATRHQKAKNI